MLVKIKKLSSSAKCENVKQY